MVWTTEIAVEAMILKVNLKEFIIVWRWNVRDSRVKLMQVSVSSINIKLQLNILPKVKGSSLLEVKR